MTCLPKNLSFLITSTLGSKQEKLKGSTDHLTILQINL